VKKLSFRSIILGIGIAVIVPLICFLILRGAGHDGHVKVPKHYGVDTVINGDTIYHTIQDNEFVNHLKDTVNLAKDFPRKMLIIGFFNTHNHPVSDKISYHMGQIQQGFKLKKTDTAIHLVSISAGHPNDDLERIRNYADAYTHDHDSWSFLLNDSLIQVNQFVDQELFPNKDVWMEKYQPLKEIVLIDKYRNIRGYYNGLDSMEIKRCIDDIALLMVEKNKIHEKKKR